MTKTPQKTVRLSSLTVNVKAEREGEWVSPPTIPGASLNVRSFNSPEYIAARSSVLRKLAEKYGDDPVPQDVIDAEEGRVYAEHILLGWQGLDEAYSHELASACLEAPEYRPLREAVAWCAARVGQRELEFVEAATKN